MSTTGMGDGGGLANLLPEQFRNRIPKTTSGKVMAIGLFIAAAGLIIVYGLPILTTMFNNLIAFGLSALALGLVGAFALNKQVWLSFTYLSKGFVRSLVKYRPDLIVRGKLDEQRQDRAEFGQMENQLAGRVGQMKEYILRLRDDAQQAMSQAATARKYGKEGEVWRNARRAQRREEAVARFIKIFRKLKMLHSYFRKVGEALDLRIADQEDAADMLIKEWESYKDAGRLMNSAIRILGGKPDAQALFQMAMDIMVEDIGKVKGEMDNFRMTYKSVIDQVDIENMQVKDEAFAMLDRWEKGDSILLGDLKGQLVAESNVDEDLDLTVGTSTPAVTGKMGRYIDLKTQG